MAVKPAPIDVPFKFIVACKTAEIPATNRQWKKWQKKTGLAYQRSTRCSRNRIPLVDVYGRQWLKRR